MDGSAECVPLLKLISKAQQVSVAEGKVGFDKTLRSIPFVRRSLVGGIYQNEKIIVQFSQRHIKQTQFLDKKFNYSVFITSITIINKLKAKFKLRKILYACQNKRDKFMLNTFEFENPSSIFKHQIPFRFHRK